MKTRLLFAAALVLLVTARIGFSFEIGVYNDPLSHFTFHWLGTHPADSTSYQTYLTNQGYSYSQMEEVYDWYNSMGVTKVMVMYPFQWCFTQVPQDCSDIKVMNTYLPGLPGMPGTKYAQAEYRDVQVGLNHDQTPNDRYSSWSYTNSIRDPAERMASGPPMFEPSQRRPVVAIGPDINFGDGSPDTLWRATSDLGTFTGWDWFSHGWLGSTYNIPMHYKLIWAVDPQGTISEGDTLADFYWIVQTPDAVTWWRYPVQALTLDTLPDTTHWIESWFHEDGVSGEYHLLDSDFAFVDSGPMTDVKWRWGQKVGMSVYYRGVHSLYLNRIEVYDEAAYQLFMRSDSATVTSQILTAFQNEYNNSCGKSAGWYYDEWSVWGESLRALIKMNKLLQDNNLPPFFTNGFQTYGNTLVEVNGPPYQGNEFMSLLRDASTHVSSHMDEFYPFGGDTNQTPHNAAIWPTIYIETSDSSDVPYMDIAAYNGPFCTGSDHGISGCDGTTWNPYIGTQSLQSALDATLEPNGNVRYVHDVLGLNTYHCPGQLDREGPAKQAAFARANNEPFWALIQGGADMGDDSCFTWPMREPTRNEVKLVAWLAVGSGVDGIMWYPFGTLIDYDATSHTFVQSDRYWGAQEVGQDIQRLAPILESLEFVRTYASRAFQVEYPNAAYEATCLDTLATNCTWYGNQHFRAVAEILTWKQSGGNWVQEPDSESYVHVSRFRNRLIELNDPTVEDYWFLIVNRRALENERRMVRLLMQIDTTYLSNPYYIDYIFGDSTISASPCAGDDPSCANRYVDVILEPGEAEFVHFYRGELGCAKTVLDIGDLTVYHTDQAHIRLTWSSINANMYFICGAARSQGPWTAFAYTQDTTYVDTVFSSLPRYFYTVQACFNSEDDDHP